MAVEREKREKGKEKRDAAPAAQGASRDEKSETARREEEVLAFWKERGIFEKSLTKDAPQGEFVFYDGPPFATGLPHMGHLLGSSIKDVVGRYKTMRGYHVPRRWGWDTHGLPIENIVEKKLALTGKKDIEAMGIGRFNTEARKTVLAYVDDWKQYVERMGRWVDFDHSYKTMDNSYIESVWWALKKIHNDKRLYEGKKVLLYCPHCETPLSKAEIAMDNSYKDVTDEAVYVKFVLDERKEKGDKRKEKSVREVFGVPDDGVPIFIVAWTTTPWTLPGNVALAVGTDIEYSLVAVEYSLGVRDLGADSSYLPPEELPDDHHVIVARAMLPSLRERMVHRATLREIGTCTGADLIGLSYEPLYEVPKARAAGSEKVWTILSADFVTTEEGTGVVHIAPMYGEDDYELGKANNLPTVQLLDTTGTYNDDAPELVRGRYYKKGGKQVIEDLSARGILFTQHAYTHSYPHCYRCGTALIYNALTSWFIDIQAVKERLIAANEEVSWYPAHLKHGRFRNIVEGAPDWTISRNRFWASPLPIWKHETTGEVTLVGSLDELRARTKKSGNRYLTMRHGRAESNDQRFISSRADDDNHLTEAGKEEVRAAVPGLAQQGITRIVTSPLVRTRETADMVADALGIARSDVVVEDRFKEWQLGVLSGKPVGALHDVCASYEQRFHTVCAPGAETLADMKQRIGAALYDLEERYQGETILIVGHEYTSWLAACVAAGAHVAESIRIRGDADDYVANAEVRVLDFVPLPHNEHYELDLHRPYLDDLPLVARDGARLVRIREVVDCWVESGLMPVASEHHLGEAFGRPERYPGDFIAEYIAQTRTWFYYMHAMGVLLFDDPSFRHCVSTGTILAEDGSKMSKSKGNFTDPLKNLDRFGADALRLYLLGSVVMQSEDMSFRDEELKDVHNRFIGILWNTYKFYEMYVGGRKEEREKREDVSIPAMQANILDRWILTLLEGLVTEVTTYMDAYDTVRAVRALREFVTDLSTWYIRRSRDRFKSEDVQDRAAAIATTRSVLLTLAELLAPLAPFIAECIYRGIGGEAESVHLAAWPAPVREAELELIGRMAEVRRLASLILEARQRAGIKVRQPLAKVTVRGVALEGDSELLALLADEVNVKEIMFGGACDGEVLLDTEITDELRREGDIRELVREVQDLRKQRGLQPHERIALTIEPAYEALVEAARRDLAAKAGVDVVHYERVVEGATYARSGEHARLAIRRVDLEV